MKKIIIVNNNMKIGGVQKSLCNMLWELSDFYDITLCLFSAVGEYMDEIPDNVKVIECKSLYRYLGLSRNECSKNLLDNIKRSILAIVCKLFGRPAVMRLISLSQKPLTEKYDAAISFLHNGRIKSFYGGVNEFVLEKVAADKKIAFLHCDYSSCGANHAQNNKLYYQFDKIAACSDGCRNVFINIIPQLGEKTVTVRNFHREKLIKAMAQENPLEYDAQRINVVIVGRLAHEKGVDRAIKAAQYAAAKKIPLTLHIIGDGAMMQELRRLTADLKADGYVIFYSEQNNPYRYMKNADLLLMTSYHEAAPMVIDEANIIGLPVMTAKTTSSDDMVLERNIGWVCENSQQGINECLEDICSVPERLRQTKLSMTATNGSNKQAAQQFAALIEE